MLIDSSRVTRSARVDRGTAVQRCFLPPSLRKSPLTNRQRQVAELVGEGLTNREIGARLYVTEKTVEMHLSQIFVKLGVGNRVGVVREFHKAVRS